MGIQSQRFLDLTSSVRQTADIGFGDCEASVRGRVARIQSDRHFELSRGFAPSTLEVEIDAELSMARRKIRARRSRLSGERFRELRLLKLKPQLAERYPALRVVFSRGPHALKHADGCGAIAGCAERAHEIVACLIDVDASLERSSK